MAENSTPSIPSGRKRTSKTALFTPEQALEILQQAVKDCRQLGLKISVSTLYGGGSRNVIIVIENTDLIDGNFVLANDGKYGTE